MNTFGINSKFLGSISTRSFQVVRRNFAEQKGDEDIKWQWSVREYPSFLCDECHKLKEKRGWFAKLFRRKKQSEELTNRHKEVIRKPKFWELEYYDYLLPECNKKIVESKAEYKYPSQNVCGGSDSNECEGKRILIHLGNDHLFQKHCSEKLSFDLKEPVKFQQVCGKTECSGSKSDTEASSSEEEHKEKKDDFCCLNNLIDDNKQKTDDKDKKSQCD